MATSLGHHPHKQGVIPLPSSPSTLIVVAFGVLLVFYLIMRLLAHHGEVEGKLDIDLTNGKIAINTHGKAADFSDVIDKLFADKQKSDDTYTLLRTRYGLYTSDDPFLASALEKLAPDHSVSRALRELVKQTKGPFGGIQRQVIIASSADKTLTGSIAASCTDSEFQGESLLITKDSTSFITLNVSSKPFLCPHPPDEPIVRVSLDMYRDLFGAIPPHAQTVQVSIYPFQPVADGATSGEPTL